MNDHKKIIASLPHLPGVYRMINAAGEAIYVGKARDLKKRVSSYFQKTALFPRTRLMVSQVARIETTVTASEAEALLLENNLIKALAPRYNILFRDDKSYPYVMFSGHRFPRLGFHRGALDKGGQYFGPFPHTGAVRESMQLLQKVFQLRTCEDSVFNNRSRPCLLHQIKRCSAPCVGLIDTGAYAGDVKNAVLFIQGKETRLLRTLSEKMEAAAAAMQYETAAAYRDQIGALRRIQERQFVNSGRGVDADVVACVARDGIVCVNLAMIRGGRHLGDKRFFPQNAEAADTQAALEAFLAQHYARQTAPSQIIVGEAVASGVLEDVLSAQARRKVKINARPIGERRAWLQMAQANGRLAVEQRLNQQYSQEARLAALQQALALPAAVQRIECFDISHTLGEATVASCVVFDKHKMQEGEYRHFNIHVAPGDDYAAMGEALQRRYRKIAAGEGRMPDLILIDGGKGQLAVAEATLAETGINSVYLAAVAKGAERQPGLEQIFFPGRAEAVRLPADHPGLHLIQQIRDESHRFAIGGHRRRRGKARTASALERIGGVGPKRRQRLLIGFGGLRGVLLASVEELAKIEGVSHALAEKIYRELH
ncbi:MAG TPA: excinuclease ABC subunit C [Betaproteobacteria bacterium]|nr:excinuclease ABC subunit C [Betaproteobacteria bacterium]